MRTVAMAFLILIDSTAMTPVFACESPRARDKGPVAAEAPKERQAKTACGGGPRVSDMYAEAVTAEKAGKTDDAIKLYIRAARGGSGASAKRLSEIYAAAKNPQESKKWYNAARVLGEDLPPPR